MFYNFVKSNRIYRQVSWNDTNSAAEIISFQSFPISTTSVPRESVTSITRWETGRIGNKHWAICHVDPSSHLGLARTATWQEGHGRQVDSGPNRPYDKLDSRQVDSRAWSWLVLWIIKSLKLPFGTCAADPVSTGSLIMRRPDFKLSSRLH